MYNLVSIFNKRKIRDYDYGDLESMLLIGYQQAAFYHRVPEFFDISNCFHDAFESSGLFSLCSNSLDYSFHRSEITEDLLEAVLFGMGAEFINIYGEHVNEAQNKLIENWRSNEPISFTDQLRLAEHC